MKLRWSNSKDRVPRVNLNIVYRLDRDHLAEALASYASTYLGTDVEDAISGGGELRLSQARTMDYIKDAIRNEGGGCWSWHEVFTMNGEAARAELIRAWARRQVDQL